MAEHWMQKAFANSHGQFKAKAHKAGMSTEAYAKKQKGNPKASTRTKRQANLAMLGAKFGGHHHADGGAIIEGEGEAPKRGAHKRSRE